MKTKLLTLLFIVIFVAPSWKNANAQVYICNGGLVSYTIDGKDSEIWYEDMNNALRSFYFAKHKGLEEDFEFDLSGPSVT